MSFNPTIPYPMPRRPGFPQNTAPATQPKEERHTSFDATLSFAPKAFNPLLKEALSELQSQNPFLRSIPLETLIERATTLAAGLKKQTSLTADEIAGMILNSPKSLTQKAEPLLRNISLLSSVFKDKGLSSRVYLSTIKASLSFLGQTPLHVERKIDLIQMASRALGVQVSFSQALLMASPSKIIAFLLFQSRKNDLGYKGGLSLSTVRNFILSEYSDEKISIDPAFVKDEKLSTCLGLEAFCASVIKQADLKSYPPSSDLSRSLEICHSLPPEQLKFVLSRLWGKPKYVYVQKPISHKSLSRSVMMPKLPHHASL